MVIVPRTEACSLAARPLRDAGKDSLAHGLMSPPLCGVPRLSSEAVNF